MKNLNVVFEDEEYAKLAKAKGDGKTWHDFFMELGKK
jgi:hypothetical protein